jgi:predicted PhzF superfamily epimerase YddE/YHI9
MMLHAPPDEAVKSPGGFTVCQSWPHTRNDRQVIAVRCYTPAGDLIQCCGHGLLSAAYGWQRALHRNRLTLEMNGSRVTSWRDESRTWLRFGGVTTSPCPVPDWTGEVFPDQPQPLAAATSGGARGYLVLQWPDNTDLYQLQPSAENLSQRTGRALICTAAWPLEDEGAIRLRYFAPQYGVPEDAATGSAMRVLAAYWSPRFDRLIARQCSPGGGLLFANWTPDHVDVGGRCIDMETVAAHA